MGTIQMFVNEADPNKRKIYFTISGGGGSGVAVYHSLNGDTPLNSGATLQPLGIGTTFYAVIPQQFLSQPGYVINSFATVSGTVNVGDEAQVIRPIYESAKYGKTHTTNGVGQTGVFNRKNILTPNLLPISKP
jgi:hypothetical protein